MSEPETQIPQSTKLGASRLLPGQGGAVLRPGPTGCTAPGHQGQWGIAKRGRLGLWCHPWCILVVGCSRGQGQQGPEAGPECTGERPHEPALTWGAQQQRQTPQCPRELHAHSPTFKYLALYPHIDPFQISGSPAHKSITGQGPHTPLLGASTPIPVIPCSLLPATKLEQAEV